MQDRPLKIGDHILQRDLIVGSGKYDTLDIMRDSLAASGAKVVTVAVRREKMYDRLGQNILDYIDPKEYCCCLTRLDVTTPSMQCGLLSWAEILRALDNPGANWVKLEVLGDSKTLLPDPVATIEACKTLVDAGFQVLCYTSDDPIVARRLKEAGATSVMPAGSPIGSGQGILNPNNLRNHFGVSQRERSRLSSDRRCWGWYGERCVSCV